MVNILEFVEVQGLQALQGTGKGGGGGLNTSILDGLSPLSRRLFHSLQSTLLEPHDLVPVTSFKSILVAVGCAGGCRSGGGHGAPQ